MRGTERLAWRQEAPMGRDEVKLLMVVAAVAAGMLLVVAMAVMLGGPPQDRAGTDVGVGQQGSRAPAPD
jgi:hypothetical protein